ncbi:hypothetical protein PYL83_12825, partial [Moraxella lacunata]|uniref:hypothetical protein n=1 Tax=Moraxella lacunata TaxID=477 RepID=UPI00248081A6
MTMLKMIRVKMGNRYSVWEFMVGEIKLPVKLDFRSPLYQPNTKPRLSARMLLGYTSKENTGSPLVS